MKAKHKEPEPGDLFEGYSHIYLLLSAEGEGSSLFPSNAVGKTKWVWKAAQFAEVREGKGDWMGAQVVPLWDDDLADMRLVGRLHSPFQWWRRLMRTVSPFLLGVYFMIAPFGRINTPPVMHIVQAPMTAKEKASLAAVVSQMEKATAAIVFHMGPKK